MTLGQADPPVARLFLRAYSGSGLLIQSRARRQLTPRRRKASRMVSSLTSAWVRPRAKQASAARFKVHSERAWPNSRGERWSKARSRSRLASSNSGRRVLGADDFCARQARPSEAKARMTLRTVWSVQPNCRAIWRGVRWSAQQQQNLAAPEREGMPRAEARAQRGTLGVSQRSDEDRFFHPSK